jgi:hypothetical protein
LDCARDKPGQEIGRGDGESLIVSTSEAWVWWRNTESTRRTISVGWGLGIRIRDGARGTESIARLAWVAYENNIILATRRAEHRSRLLTTIGRTIGNHQGFID